MFDVEIIEDTKSYATYTHVLHELIRRTKTAMWGRGTDIIPNTPAWRRWTDEAEENADNDQWDGPKRLTELLAVPTEQVGKLPFVRFKIRNDSG